MQSSSVHTNVGRLAKATAGLAILTDKATRGASPVHRIQGVYAGTPENSVTPTPPSTCMRSGQASERYINGTLAIKQGDVSLADRGMDTTPASGELTFPRVRRQLRNMNAP